LKHSRSFTYERTLNVQPDTLRAGTIKRWIRQMLFETTLESFTFEGLGESIESTL
jgi:hypothetical protein